MIMRETDIEKGTVMWKVGDKAEFAFLVKKGTFAFFDCQEQENDELDSGAFVGEVKALMEGTVCTTSVRATRKATIFKIIRKDLIQYLNKHPGIYMIMIESKFIE